MLTRIYPIVSASLGTLTGYLLWFATIAFVLAIITGFVG
jgi:hypothetical protein